MFGPSRTACWWDEHTWVSEPASKKLHMVHLSDGEVEQSIQLDVVPDELNGVEG